MLMKKARHGRAVIAVCAALVLILMFNSAVYALVPFPSWYKYSDKIWDKASSGFWNGMNQNQGSNQGQAGNQNQGGYPGQTGGPNQGGYPGQTGGPSQGGYPYVGPPALNFDQMVDRLEYDVPTWEQLSAFFKDLKRLPCPKFEIRGGTALSAAGSMGEDLNGVEGSTKIVINSRRQASQKLPINISAANGVTLPPYLDENWKPITSYPLSATMYDKHLRVMAVAYLVEKRAGMPVSFHDLWPPLKYASWPVAKTVDEFWKWNREVYLPMKIKEAQTAELLKAEYYVPFPIEAERFFSEALQPYLGKLPEAELFKLTQEWIDSVADAVRPYFKGRLTAQAYTYYDALGDSMSELSFKKYDQLGFTIFPPGGDLEACKAYFRKQLGNYSKIIKKSGIPWGVVEIDLYDSYFQQYGVKLTDDFLAALYQELFNQLDAMDPQPISFVAGERELGGNAPKTKEVMMSYLNKHK